MSLFKRGEIWWVRFTAPNGQQVRRSAQTANKQQAQEFHDTLKTECWRVAKLGDKPRHRWQDAVERWLTEKKGERKATLYKDVAHFRWLHNHLYERYLDEINRDVIDSIAAAKLKEQVSNGTVNRILALIRAVLRRAANEWEWLDKAPHVRLLSEPRKRVRWLTPDEAKYLLAELPEHLAEMMRFTLATGLRERNVTRMEWKQVDLERRCAWICADQAKAGKAIAVPLNDDAVKVVKRQAGNNSRFVFTYHGKPVLRANNHAWLNALKRAGIEDFRWHDLRHTWASWHVQQGTPLYVLQELGGWAGQEMVQRYAHLSAQHLAHYANQLALVKTVSTKSVTATDQC